MSLTRFIQAIGQLDAQSAQPQRLHWFVARDQPPGTASGTHNSTFNGYNPADPDPPGAQIAPGPSRRRQRRFLSRLEPNKGLEETMHPGNLALIFHVLIEAPASLSFLLSAPKQLRESRPSPEAVLVCQSYGGLLFATNVMCVLLLYRRGSSHFGDASAIVAVSLAMYHAMPIRRAWVRIKTQGAGRGWLQQADAMGGPYVHFLVHALLLVSLTWAGLHGIVRGKLEN